MKEEDELIWPDDECDGIVPPDYNSIFNIERITNTVVKDDEGYWFYNETFSSRFGPFSTFSECEKGLNLYCRVELEGETPTKEEIEFIGNLNGYWKD
jgi:hypothetical protein